MHARAVALGIVSPHSSPLQPITSYRIPCSTNNERLVANPSCSDVPCFPTSLLVMTRLKLYALNSSGTCGAAFTGYCKLEYEFSSVIRHLNPFSKCPKHAFLHLPDTVPMKALSCHPYCRCTKEKGRIRPNRNYCSSCGSCPSVEPRCSDNRITSDTLLMINEKMTVNG